jgi:protein subunit release factor A
MKRQLSIKAAEGGSDAQLFVNDLATAYLKLADRLNWKVG